MRKNAVALPGSWHGTPLRVRYQETDGMGVVYHSNYLNWFEVARTEMLRELGFAYRMLEEQGVMLPVTAAELQYKSPARYDDQIRVYTRVSAFSPLRMAFEYEVRRSDGLDGEEAPAGSGDLLVTGKTEHVWVDRTWKPCRLERVLPEQFAALTEALR
ncbi:acyl-CoA thioesterase [Paenibacillus glufosinatiresistens]|uniref:acyl-CoA thioesterase n=1 Tax=Paenibacillus glufosinatiresistens TaxID=3070657 RepID=UPI00286DD235|nr:thioesterase family protein [Paenibacillus sp. YX.27]